MDVADSKSNRLNRERSMKKTVVIDIVTLMFGAIGAYGISQYHAKQQ